MAEEPGFTLEVVVAGQVVSVETSAEVARRNVDPCASAMRARRLARAARARLGHQEPMMDREMKEN